MNCTPLTHRGSYALPYSGTRYASTKPPPKPANSKPASVKAAHAPPSTQPSNPQSSPSAFSPKKLNAFAVDHLTARAHPSRPPPKINDGRVPDKYKPAARRITYAMVAMPIAIVTSYVLWNRLVMGQERKRLVGEPMIADEEGN
ncbi:hypothetical protein MMC30_001068 [Trapelia coarctata]|nr:hypothetical protein [Trapelia coarctata]